MATRALAATRRTRDNAAPAGSTSSCQRRACSTARASATVWSMRCFGERVTVSVNGRATGAASRPDRAERADLVAHVSRGSATTERSRPIRAVATKRPTRVAAGRNVG
jgi:hypothetical protein